MTLTHEPNGMGHPYVQDAWERFPRAPRAAEGVTIGVLAVGAPSDTLVSVTATTTGEAREIQAAAELSHETSQGRIYRARLADFKEGDRVSYSIRAECGDQSASIGPFGFSVPRAYRVGHLVCGAQADGILTVEAETTWSGHTARFSFSLDQSGSLRITPSFQAPTETHPAASRRSLRARVGSFGVMASIEPLCFTILGSRGEELLRETEPFSFMVDEAEQLIGLRQVFACASGEAFFGFGERFNGLNQRGRTIDNRVYDNYCRQGMKTYIPMPYFLSSRGYGHFIETPGPVLYRMDSDASATWSYDATSTGGLPSAHVFAGEPRSIVRGFRALTGKAKLPPAWAFGPWMSGNEWNNQKRVMEVADRSRDLGIPAGVLVIEAWSDEATFSIWNEARYTPRDPSRPFSLADFTFPADGLWPDPKAMIDELHRRGIKVVLWQIPVLKKLSAPHPQHDRDQQFAREQGLCVKTTDGSPYIVRPPWFRGAMAVDFTNPAAARWWFDRRRYLLEEMGVDGFKTDGGEHLWGEGIVLHDGTREAEAWNSFVNPYLAGYRRFIEEDPAHEVLTFSRAGYVGAQQYPLHWNGDQDSSWESHASTLFACLNAGLCGIPFIGWDIGGFAGPIPSAELYLRSAAMALFSPLMQYHSDFNNHKEPCIDRTPWNIAEQTGVAEVVDIYRRFAKARVAMMPYLLEEARFCVESGDPLMRPLFLDWPAVAEAWSCADQYMFGRNVLVAPVLEPGLGAREVYLPPGQWECVESGRVVRGEQRVMWPAPIQSIPAFMRVGSSFPVEEVRQALHA